jgi:transglutaminase-like putative cysteine protease
VWLRTTCELSFELTTPTPLILMLRPRSGRHQWIARESFELDPMPTVAEYTDPLGNLGQRLVAPAGSFHMRHQSDVRTRPTLAHTPGARFVPPERLPDSVLPFLLPSRYCESEQFVQMAGEIVGAAEPGFDQVWAIANWVHRHVRLNPESPHFQQSAGDVNRSREGVCRELAHLAMALCRALCIPARMVVGYLHRLEPMDMHAWLEAYVGDAWYTFDPTQRERRGGRVAVGQGRDAVDVAIYNQFGPPAKARRMHIAVEALDSDCIRS